MPNQILVLFSNLDESCLKAKFCVINISNQWSKLSHSYKKYNYNVNLGCVCFNIHLKSEWVKNYLVAYKFRSDNLIWVLKKK